MAVIREDVRDLENVRDISGPVASSSAPCVGSLLSINQLRKLLQGSHESVERWETRRNKLRSVYPLTRIST